MTVTREQVAHLRAGMEVTVRWQRHDGVSSHVTGELELVNGCLVMGAMLVRGEDGRPGFTLAEVVSPLPPEPPREPGWYRMTNGEVGVIAMCRYNGKEWLNMYGRTLQLRESDWLVSSSRVADLDGSPVPAQAPAPCGRRHVQPSEVVIDLDAVETSFLRTVADAVGDELEHRAAEISASL